MYYGIIFNVHSLNIKRPVGAYRIAHFLREHGWDIEVVEWAAYWDDESLKEFVKSRMSSNCKFFGFSSFFTYWPQNIESFVNWLKKSYPDIPTIFGTQGEPNVSSTGIDYYITGYGEYGILKLLNHLYSNDSAVLTDLRYFGEKNVISCNKTYPAYPLSSLMVDYEERDFLLPNEWLTIEFGRGCKFKCTYCNFPILGVKGDYSRDATDFATQLQKTYDRFGITNYIGADETFNDRSEKIIKFADAVETLSFRPWFSGFIRGDLLVANPEDKEHLLRLGFAGHFYGVETGNKATGKAIGKGMDPDKLLNGILDIKKYFKKHNNNLYRGIIALIVGLPHETVETQEKTIQWIIDNWQEEAVQISSLTIPINDKTDTLSTFSKTWSTYYTDLGVDKEYPGYLQWKSPNMDIWQADDIVTKAEERFSKLDFRANPFMLDDYIEGNLIQTALNKPYHSKTNSTYHQTTVAEYSIKKLNYTGK
jgi:radical SAM superfamily enzyme YgiQ (UPF0313 family)